MDTALGWIGDLVKTLAAVFPRLCLVTANNRGVLFTRGNVRLLLPGMHWFWPVWSRVEIVNVTRDTTQLHYQSLITSDEEQVTVSVTVTHGIDDAVTSVAEVADIKGAIADIAAVAVKQLIIKRSWDELKSDQARVDKMLTRRCRRLLAPYGVGVESAYISELTKPVNIRLMQSGG